MEYVLLFFATLFGVFAVIVDSTEKRVRIFLASISVLIGSLLLTVTILIFMNTRIMNMFDVYSKENGYSLFVINLTIVLVVIIKTIRFIYQKMNKEYFRLPIVEF
jgi:hypothetical protein